MINKNLFDFFLRKTIPSLTFNLKIDHNLITFHDKIFIQKVPSIIEIKLIIKYSSDYVDSVNGDDLKQ